MEQLKWDRRMLHLAEYISTWSKDPSSQIGAVLAHGNKVVGIGYNGFPIGILDTDERLNNRDLKYKMVVHAEVNACIMAGTNAKGASLYVVPTFVGAPCVCHDCAKTIIQFGVAEVVNWHNPNPDQGRVARWAESLEIAKTMCDEAGVRYREVIRD